MSLEFTVQYPETFPDVLGDTPEEKDDQRIITAQCSHSLRWKTC